MKPTTKFFTLLFLTLLSCKDPSPHPLDKFTGSFKHGTTSFVFTKESESLRVTIDGKDYGYAAVYGSAFGVFASSAGLTVSWENGKLIARYVKDGILVIEGKELVRG